MSQDLTENNRKWLDRDKKKVTIDNRKYKLIVKTWDAIYPHSRKVISVQAEMINKNSNHYKAIVKELKDDWSIDILDSEIDVQCFVDRQFN